MCGRDRSRRRRHLHSVVPETVEREHDVENEANIRVLVVDDRAANRLSINALLAESEVEIVEASSGEEALELTEDGDFALILLDVRLPGIDGLSTAERLRTNSMTRHVPIIFLTAFEGMKDQVRRAYALGAVDFLTKPIVPEMLLAKMSVFIDLFRKREELRYQQELLRESQSREHERHLREETARWEAEQLKRDVAHQTKLAEERGRQAVILDCIKEAVIAIDRERRVSLLNNAAERLLGLSLTAVQGAQVDDVLSLYDAESNARVQPEDVVGDVLVRLEDGTEHVLSDSAGPLVDANGESQGSVFVYRDVTVQRRMEREIQNRQRVESLGVLAGGIAHDFNNMLGMILASTTMLSARVGIDSKSAKLIAGIEETCENATALTRQLLTFSKGGAPTKKLCDPQPLIRDSVELALKGGRTKCEFSFETPTWPAELDAGQVTQVLSNLILNAREASLDQGAICVTGRNVRLEGSKIDLPDGPYVEITVRDQGPGISPTELGRIFEPYFSTKENHHGLGLASAYSIVRRHGGLLFVDSTVSDGASFVAYFPAQPDSSPQASEATSEDYSSNGRVLIMDDEPRLRELLRDCLLALHCRVEVAEHGDAALRIYERAMKDDDPFDVVVLDLTIRGGLGGAETVKAMRALSPGVLAIACSGYANDPIMCDHENYGFAAAIEKPFRFAVLARAVRSLIARNQATRARLSSVN